MEMRFAPDLTTSVPRSGREELGGYAWLARFADKARAEAAGTQGEYVAYCPLSLGWLQRVGIERRAFAREIEGGAADDALVRFLDERVAPQRKAAANRFVLEEKAPNLDEQDAEEGRRASERSVARRAMRPL